MQRLQSKSEELFESAEVLACPKLQRDAEELCYKLNYERPGAPCFDEPPDCGRTFIDRTRIDYGSFGLSETSKRRRDALSIFLSGLFSIPYEN